MGKIQEEIQSLVERDTHTDPHHLGPGRVDVRQMHPSKKDLKKVSKVRASYKARAVVEAVHALKDQRPMNALDSFPADVSYGEERGVDLSREPTLVERNNITVKKCAYDYRGAVAVHCVASDYVFDLPIYLVSPSILVEDENGDIEVIEDPDQGDTLKFKEDPVEAMFQVLVSLKYE